MAEYKAIDGRVTAFLAKWKKSNYLLISVVLGIFILSSLNYFIKMDVGGIIFMLTTCIFFYWLYGIRSAIKEANKINQIIISVTVNGSDIRFVTMSVFIFWGLIKREPGRIEFGKGNFTFEAPKTNYPLNNKSLESPYILRNENKEYYLVEGFFDGFEGLKRSLE